MIYWRMYGLAHIIVYSAHTSNLETAVSPDKRCQACQVLAKGYIHTYRHTDIQRCGGGATGQVTTNHPAFPSHSCFSGLFERLQLMAGHSSLSQTVALGIEVLLVNA